MREGLTDTDALARLTRDGPNELPVSRPRSVLRLLGDVVVEPMFLLLVACGVIYLALGDRNEALMLLGFVFVVMGITFVQQRRTDRSLEALRAFAPRRAPSSAAPAWSSAWTGCLTVWQCRAGWAPTICWTAARSTRLRRSFA